MAALCAIVALTGVFALQAPAAAAVTESLTAANLTRHERSSVRIERRERTCAKGDECWKFAGTGTFVDRYGTIVTAAHVLNGIGTPRNTYTKYFFRIKLDDGKPRDVEAKEPTVDGKYDIACLSYTVAPRERIWFMPVGDPQLLANGAALRVVGHLGDDRKRDVELTLEDRFPRGTKDSALWKVSYKKPVGPGDSGGGIADVERRTLVAVVSTSAGEEGLGERFYAAQLIGNLPCVQRRRTQGTRGPPPAVETWRGEEPTPAPQVKNSAFIAVDSLVFREFGDSKTLPSAYKTVLSGILRAFGGKLFPSGRDSSGRHPVETVTSWTPENGWATLRDKGYSHFVVAKPYTFVSAEGEHTRVRLIVGKIRNGKLVELGVLAFRLELSEVPMKYRLSGAAESPQAAIPRDVIYPDKPPVSKDAPDLYLRGGVEEPPAAGSARNPWPAYGLSDMASAVANNLKNVFPELRRQFFYAVECFPNRFEHGVVLERAYELQPFIAFFLSKNLGSNGPIGLQKSEIARRMEENAASVCTEALQKELSRKETASLIDIQIGGQIDVDFDRPDFLKVPVSVENKIITNRWQHGNRLLTTPDDVPDTFIQNVERWKNAEFDSYMKAENVPLVGLRSMTNFCPPENADREHVGQALLAYIRSHGKLDPYWACDGK